MRNDGIGMGERGFTLAKFLVELVVRVDDKCLLESLEGVALGLEYFHGGVRVHGRIVWAQGSAHFCLSFRPRERSGKRGALYVSCSFTTRKMHAYFEQAEPPSG
jgi:hypothetical protein